MLGAEVPYFTVKEGKMKRMNTSKILITFGCLISFMVDISLFICPKETKAAESTIPEGWESAVRQKLRA